MMTAELAFVIADFAGYTALTEAHGGAEAARTVARFAELAAKALAADARLAERVGDQVLIVAADAGIDVGAVVEQGGRYFGERIESFVCAYRDVPAWAGAVACTAAASPRNTISLHGRCTWSCATVGSGARKQYYQQVKGGPGHLRVVPRTAEFLSQPGGGR